MDKKVKEEVISDRANPSRMKSDSKYKGKYTKEEKGKENEDACLKESRPSSDGPRELFPSSDGPRELCPSSEEGEKEEVPPEMTKEERAKWNNRVFENIKRRKSMLMKHYGFSKENFASKFEQNIGVDFSIQFMEDCYPKEFFSWPMEKQAQLANAKVRAPVLHKDGWSMVGIRTNINVLLMILRLFLVFRTNAEIMGNLSFQALYSDDVSCRRKAYCVYYIANWLAWFYQLHNLLCGTVFFLISWMFLPSTLPTSIYIPLYVVTLVGFMWCLFHINLVFGDYRRKMQAKETDEWDKPLMKKVEELPEEEKRLFDDIQLRAWSARIELAKNGDSLKKKIK